MYYSLLYLKMCYSPINTKTCILSYFSGSMMGLS